MTVPPAPLTRSVAARDVVSAALPLILVIVAEAAWISVLAGLVQEYALRDTVPGIPMLGVFVGVGVGAARYAARRLDDRWPRIAVALAGLGAVAGCLASLDARSAFAAGNVGSAVASSPGYLLAGLAVVRGYAHADMPLRDESVARLLSRGIPGLAVVALLGGAVADPWRSAFLDHAFLGSAIFVATAIPALAFTRLGEIGRRAGFEWRRNRAWTALVVVLVLAIVVAATRSATIAGPAVELLIGVAIVPAFLAGLLIGSGRAWRTIAAFVVAAAVLTLALTLFAPTDPPPGTPPVAPPPGTPTDPADQVMAFGFGGILLVVSVVVVLVLARLWMQRIAPPEESDVPEVRWIDVGTGPRRGRPRVRWRQQSAPTDAAAAYLALLDDLASRAPLGRTPGETPAEHAARLRRAGTGALSLDLLAADYALARFAGVRLTTAEDRRAIGRWRTLRRRLGRPDRTRLTPGSP